MKRLKLVHYPNKVLRDRAVMVTKNRFDASLRELAQQMWVVMNQFKGVGIAAQQVGSRKRIMIVWDGKATTKPVVCVNPAILEVSENEVTMAEGCLSFPGIRREISRPERVHVSYQNLRGEVETAWIDGILARCYQHELDHLDGVLFIDKEEYVLQETPAPTLTDIHVG